MVTTSYCRHCGADATGSGRYCASCGYVLAASGEQVVDRLLTRLRDATVGEYDIVRQLGRGGMAAVYLAWDLDLARYVAIKVMFPELELQEGMAQRFLREARLAAILDDHPNVVRVYRARDVDGMRFFAMKYIDGCSLEQMLRAVGPLPIGIVCHIVDQVARALHHAHGRGIVHRDVKPSNVMLDRTGQAIVTDFGIARAAEGEHLTRTGFAIGTPPYMSPEQWRGEEFSAASDQYALGAVAYQMLTGMLPHGGTPYEMQEGHIRQAPAPLRDVRDDCPPMLASIVHRMLAKRPQDRWPDLSTVSTLLLDLAGAPSTLLATELSALVPIAAPASNAGGEGVTPHSPIVPARIVTAASEPTPAAPASGASTPRTPIPTASAMAADTSANAAPAGPPDAAPGDSSDGAPNFSDDGTAVVDLSVAPSLADTAFTPRVTAAHATIPPGEARRTPMGLPQISTAETHAAFALPAPNPRRQRWIVGAAAITVVGAAIFLVVTSSARNGAPVARTPDAIRRPDSTVPSAAGGETKAIATESTTAPTESTTAATPAPVPVDTARADTTASAPARIVIGLRGLPADQRVPVGDSVAVVAQVLDAKGRRVPSAVPTWSARDTSGLAWHNFGPRRYAVARAAGGRLTVTATVGGVRQSLTITAGPARPSDEAAPRPVAPPPPPSTAPSVSELGAALTDLQGLLRSGRLSRLEPADGDAGSARDFVAWLAQADGIHVEGIEPLHNVTPTGRGEAVADYAVRLSWRVNRFKRNKADLPAKLRLVFSHEDGAWRHTRTQLLERFTPK
jgi:serine/threonine protein kinase